MKKPLILSPAIIPANAETIRFLCEKQPRSYWSISTSSSRITFTYAHGEHPYLVKAVFDDHGSSQITRYFTFKGEVNKIEYEYEF